MSLPPAPGRSAGTTASAEELLVSAGVRATSIRSAVLGRLLQAACPLSRADLAEPEGPDRVTLYRTLHLLRQAQLVHAVQGMDGVWRYCAHPLQPSGCPGNHTHFLCEGCGRMWCLTAQRLPQVEVPEGVSVRGKQLVVYGLCRECRAR